MRYAACDGGKRLRPLLCLAAASDLGGGAKAIHAACAVELVHCYSLIHDDLPCMDDDDLRRGKPSCHRKFGEAIALLAGDALLTLSFSRLAKAGLGDKAHALLADAVGHAGMVGGQAMDVTGQAADSAALRRMHALKTGCLIQASVELGAMSAGASRRQAKDCAEFGRHLGLAYQIADDINDATGSLESTGKQAGMDRRRGRKTMVTELGVDGAKRKLATERKAIEARLDKMATSDRLRGMFVGIFPSTD